MKNFIQQNKFKKYQIMSILIFLLIDLFSLISPYLMGRIVDDYIPNHDLENITKGIVLFVLIPFITILLQMLTNYILIKYIRKKEMKYR